MSHTYNRFTKYKSNKRPTTWHHMKLITRLCTQTLGYDKYRFGLQHDGLGLNCIRKTTKTLYNHANQTTSLLFDKRGLKIHFGSETLKHQHKELAVKAMTAVHNQKDANDKVSETLKKLQTATEDRTKTEQKHQQAIHHQTTVRNNLNQSERLLMNAQQILNTIEDQLVNATLVNTEAMSALELAFKQLKKAKKKAKKAKKKKKKIKLREIRDQLLLEHEQAERNAADASQEHLKYETFVQDETTKVKEAEQKMNERQVKVKEATALRGQSAKEMGKAMRVVVQIKVKLMELERQLSVAIQIKEATQLDLERSNGDLTFENWPSKGLPEFPNDFKNYESYQHEDKMILTTGPTTDIYFQGSDGQNWTQKEMILIAACIGHGLGWVPISGPCFTKVEKEISVLYHNEMEEVSRLAEEKIMMELRYAEERRVRAEERRVTEMKWQKDGLEM